MTDEPTTSAVPYPDWMDERSYRTERAFEPFMLFATLLVIPSIILEFNSNPVMNQVGYVLNVMIWFAFLLEVLVMLWVVPNRMRWIRAHVLEVGIVILTPPIPLTAGNDGARMLRLLRLFRLLQVGKLARRYLSGRNVDEAALLLLVVIVGTGAAVAGVESSVDSTWEGIWRTFSWATVGEDLPETAAGRAIAGFVLLLGIAFVSYITGAVAATIVSVDTEEHEHEEAVATAKAAGSSEEFDSPEEVLARELAGIRRELHELREEVGALGAAARDGGKPSS